MAYVVSDTAAIEMFCERHGITVTDLKVFVLVAMIYQAQAHEFGAVLGLYHGPTMCVWTLFADICNI